MGSQSSRIIWGRNKTDGSSEPQPVGLYDSEGTIYISGNYAIHSDGTGTVAEDYHLYLCTASETGSTWNSEDWKLQKGVKNWYLVSFRNFKKGARVIKSDTNGDLESLKLYKCIDGMSTPNVWKDSEWAVVYQDVGIAYQARDHKDVYYDNGRNANKWHKMMYYLPPDPITAYEFSPTATYEKGDIVKYNGRYYEYTGSQPFTGPWTGKGWCEVDDKISEEIMIFDENRQYHKDDQVIHEKPHSTEIGLYKYISTTPRTGVWNSLYWELVEGVNEYEANIAYSKNDRCIKQYIEIYDLDIIEFQSGLRYSIGKYCLHTITKEEMEPEIENFSESKTYSRGDLVAHVRGIYEYNLNIPLAGPWIEEYWTYLRPTFFTPYRDRILSGETIFGLYRSIHVVQGSWDLNDWELIIDGTIQIKGRSYNTNGLCIMQFQIGSDYLQNDVCIWTAEEDDSEFGLCVAKQDIYNCSPLNAPPNRTYWDSLNENVENQKQYHLYKAKVDISASDNSHFQRENWLTVEQKILPDDGLYGVIWEKYGKPGGGAGIPFGFPIVISGYLLNTMKANLDILYPFLGNSCLEIEKGFESSDWTYPCSGGQSFLSNIVYTLSSNSDTIKRYMVYSLTGFRTLTLDDFSLIRSSTFFNEGLIYFDQLGNRDDDAPPSSSNYYPYGKLYRSYFGTDNIFGKTQIIDIPKSYNHSGYCVFLPYNYSHSWNDPDDAYMYLYSQDGITLLVNTAPEGMLMNVPTSLSGFTQSTWGNCWRDTEIIKRTFCYVTDSGTIVPMEYFTDYCGCDTTYTNGIETAYYPDTGTNYDLFGGRMNNKSYYDFFPSPNVSTGLEVICGAIESPWFDEDWASFPFAELRECYVGQYISEYQHKPADSDVLNHMRLFCNQFGLEYDYSEETEGASAIGHSYCLNIQHWHMISGSSIQKIGYVYRDRYGGVYIFCHKIMRVSYYDYDENRYRFLESHKWGKVEGSTLSNMYSYIAHYPEYAPDIEKKIGHLLIAGRCDDYLIAATIISAGVVAKYKIDLKTGSMTAYDFPLYYDLPYVGNENFSVNGRQYRKVRVYVGLYWPTYVYNMPEVDNDTYVLPVVPSFNTYWTPYIANIGGVAHTGDWVTVITSGTFQSSDTYWVIYVPQPLTNKFGIGGFVFASSNSNSDYRVSPSYGGPGNNGFINK